MGSGKPDNEQMTIGELARRTGMTVRNIRAHQTRGLLPPPEVHGRTGYYNEDHVGRIEMTREMQAEGLNLEAIRRVLETADGSTREVVDFARALRAPFEDETPEIIELAELAASWGAGEVDPELIRRADELGIVRELPDAKIEVISPRLLRAGTALVDLGVRPDAALETATELHKQAEGVAIAFINLFVKEIWGPFQEAGRPEPDWAKVREAFDRMRPLASDALLAMFQLTMAEQSEKAAENTLRAAATEPPREKASPGGKRRD